MKKVVNSNTDASNIGVPKQKERHIVSWSQEEDDILREQIRVHGTENWAIIASKFKDKTTRQCRRRWFTYLNSDFKKGGWSPEEDLLLCEAQKVFGNRWTEIAKVVSGRTDNAVKNRFTTLCKRRAKALAKENNTTSYINLNNKRVVFRGGSETAAPLKKIRTYVSNAAAENQDEKLAGECDAADHLRRNPFSVVAQNGHMHDCDLPTQLSVHHVKGASMDGSENTKTEGTFLKKDDPKVLALMQQAELLSSLAIKVNSQKTDQSLESAWIALQNFQKQNTESDLTTFSHPDIKFQLENCKELAEDLRSSNEGSGPSWREPHMCDSSSASSEYSTGSTLLSNVRGDIVEECQTETRVLHQETGNELQSHPLYDQHCLSEESEMCHNASGNEANMALCNDVKDNNDAASGYSNMEFSSPLHVTPLFRALAATIPSPKFSESERHFLMKTLGMELNSPSTITDPSQPPPCKRSLLHCL